MHERWGCFGGAKAISRSKKMTHFYCTKLGVTCQTTRTKLALHALMYGMRKKTVVLQYTNVGSGGLARWGKAVKSARKNLILEGSLPCCWRWWWRRLRRILRTIGPWHHLQCGQRVTVACHVLALSLDFGWGPKLNYPTLAPSTSQ